MAFPNYFYDKHVPDYKDLDNHTKECPGYRFSIWEKDAGIGIGMGPINDQLGGPTYYDTFINVNEVRDIINTLQETINRVLQKSSDDKLHDNRVKEIKE